MGRARNQRSRNECTFLETVRDAIHHLQTDISSIKDSMTVIAKFLHEPLHLPDIMPTPCDNFVSNHWDEWSAGFNLQANSWGSGLNVHAVDFIPAHEQAWVPLSRDALLAFRHTVPEESERSDLKLCASARAYCHPRGYADENEACTIADDELSLACSARNHVPSSKQDFIKHDSATWLELKAEAASVIQTWWRGITCKPCGPAATGTEWFADNASIAGFSRAQLDHVIDYAIEQFVEKCGPKSGTTVNDYVEIANSVKEALPPYPGPDEADILFKPEQVQKIIELVTSSCTQLLEQRM